jgi:hypothetical protein
MRHWDVGRGVVGIMSGDASSIPPKPMVEYVEGWREGPVVPPEPKVGDPTEIDGDPTP